MVQNETKILSVVLHISGIIHHLIFDFYSWYSSKISPGVFLPFSKFWYSGLLGGRGQGKRAKSSPKWQKKCLPHLLSQEPYIKWSSFVVHKCKIITSPVVFFIFSKFWFFRLLGGSKGKKWPIITNNLYLRNHISYDLDLWCICVKG